MLAKCTITLYESPAEGSLAALRPADDESGMALLGYAIFLGLLLVLAGGIFFSTTSLGNNAPLSADMNRARAAAAGGVTAVDQYYTNIGCNNSPNCDAPSYTPALAMLASASGSMPCDGNTSATISSSVVADTLSAASVGAGITGFLVVRSAGNYAQSQAINQSVLNANTYNLNAGNANFIMNGKATDNGHVQNQGGGTVYVATQNQNPATSLIFNGTGVTYLPEQQFPKISPNGIVPYATLLLTLNTESNPVVTIPQADISFYEGLLDVNFNAMTGATTLSNGSVQVPLVSFDPNGTYITYDNTSETWTFKGFPNGIDGVFYFQGNLLTGYGSGDGNSVSNSTQQLTAAATGTITETGHATSYDPFDATGLGYNNCQSHPGISSCQNNHPYPFLEGVAFISNGDNTVSGQQMTVNGDIATNGAIDLYGGGNKTFGGILIARNGLDNGTAVHGGITFTNKVNGANTATTGGMVFSVETRWCANINCGG